MINHNRILKLIEIKRVYKLLNFYDMPFREEKFLKEQSYDYLRKVEMEYKEILKLKKGI